MLCTATVYVTSTVLYMLLAYCMYMLLLHICMLLLYCIYVATAYNATVMCRYELEPYYHVTSMKVMRLRSQETLSGRKEFIVVGATAVVGEEVNAKGKVCLLYDLCLVDIVMFCYVI